MTSMLELVKTVYENLENRQASAKKILGREHLTTAEKVFLSHLDPEHLPDEIIRGKTQVVMRPDRVAMQDATAQMAILQFMQAGRDTVAVPSTVHCDHLIRAQEGAEADNHRAKTENSEVYQFLKSAAAKYGMGFWGPGSGIIHQVVLEKYAFPGGMMIGTDSHTPNAGGSGMIAIGVGGADAADVMAGLPWVVRMPELIGVKLTGELNGWAAPKDVILKLCGILTTKGGTNKIVEYFGEGADSISATGKGTITNMGAELGATTSIFPFDDKISAYLKATERAEVAELAEKYRDYLRADADVIANPEKYYDQVIEINLSELEPHVVGPHSPDRARPLSEFAKEIAKEGFPERLSAALIGSCTNSSYEDLERAASLARQAREKGLKAKSYLLITPGSEQVRQTIERDGQLKDFTDVGAVVLSNACGPCIGNWDRKDIKKGETNAIVSSFNRNFPKRNDGNPATLSFITSPDLVMALAFAGTTTFNPMTDDIDGFKFEPPVGPEEPENGYEHTYEGYHEPPAERAGLEVSVAADSKRLEILEPFSKWDGQDYTDVPVLLKTWGQTTTDHISPAGKDWLPLRGHLSGISHNMLLGAVDADTKKVVDPVMMDVCGVERGASSWALKALELKKEGKGFIIVGDENYGEGSSREHAAMSPRLLGCKAVIARSFARIHETNLKKQGILALYFTDKSDYEKIHKNDTVDIVDLSNLAPGKPVSVVIKKQDGTTVTIETTHTLSKDQITWFQAGSAMNSINN